MNPLLFTLKRSEITFDLSEDNDFLEVILDIYRDFSTQCNFEHTNIVPKYERYQLGNLFIQFESLSI